MGRKKGTPAYIIEEPENVDQAYRQLAIAICRQAVSDYTDCLIKPDYEEEVKTADQFLSKAKSIRMALSSREKLDDEYAQAAKETLLSEMQRALSLTFMRSETVREKLPLLMEQLSARNWKRSLLTTATQYVSACKSAYVYVYGLDSQRRADIYKLEKFIEGPDFALYTGGIVDPEAVIAECKSCAKRGQRIFMGE